MIFFTGETLPSDQKIFESQFLPTYQREVGWKIEHEFQKKLSKEMFQDKRNSIDQGKAGTAAGTKGGL